MTRDRLRLIESQREAAQVELDRLKSASERNIMGQYSTPFPLAVEIVKFVKRWLQPGCPIHFLEPALGTGVFFSALLHAFPRDSIASAIGVELDPQVAKVAKKLWGALGLDVIEADFTRLPFPGLPTANLLVTNPPYVRHHHIDKQAKHTLQDATRLATGLRLNGLAGLYCYFLLVAHRWLADDGLGVWLIPSEFMDVNYGAIVKRYLTEQVTLHYIHRFDPADVQFRDALVSSAILIYQKRRPSIEHAVTFSLGGTLTTPRLSKQVFQSQLGDIRKWTALPNKSARYIVRDVRRLNAAVTIGDLFSIKRGLATGANDFFILSRQLAREKGIPSRFLRPILPSPRYLNDDVIYAGSDGYPLIDPSLVLLDCDLAEEEVVRFPVLKAYLDEGLSQGIAERYIPSHRAPWFKQEDRPAAPILCSYMSRNKAGTSGIRFFRNHSHATAPNVYLMLYPKPLLLQAIEENPRLLEEVFDLLKQASHEHLLYEGRTYGGGLNKIEPKELARVPLPDAPRIRRIGTAFRQLWLLEQKTKMNRT